MDLKQKSLQALVQSLELAGGFTVTPPDPNLEKGKSGAFAKPKEALLLALSDLQCNDWEVSSLGHLLLSSDSSLCSESMC